MYTHLFKCISYTAPVNQHLDVSIIKFRKIDGVPLKFSPCIPDAYPEDPNNTVIDEN